ncbi:MAG: hypothetical protein H7A39_05040 [Chlamydiales bacterium]|nr:hypothetical protein [Chlamydiales bacterium]
MAAKQALKGPSNRAQASFVSELDQSADHTLWGLSDLINALRAIANQNG